MESNETLVLIKYDNQDGPHWYTDGHTEVFSMCQNSFICEIQIETKTVIVAKDLC